MELPSRQEIKNNLKEIATSAGYSGSAVDLIISIMSTGYYETLLRSIGVVRESNTETAASINSLISLAADRMYHTFRGTCPSLILEGISSKKQTLKRGYKVWSSPEFNLYVKEDTTLESNKTTEIPLIASKKYLEDSKKNTSDRYYVEFLLSNLSEDIKLYIQPDQTEFLNNNIGDLVIPKLNFREHVKDDSINNILDITIAEFGVRYYMKTPNDYNFSISAFEYSEDLNDSVQDLVNSAMEEVDTLNPKVGDLKAKFSISKFSPLTLSISSLSLPRETKEEIKTNYNNQLESIYLIRSNSDLKDSFNLAFSYKSVDVNLQLITKWDSSKILDDSYNWVPYYPESSDVPLVVFYYIPKNELNLIGQSDFSDYLDSVKFYYLFDNLFCCEGVGLEMQLGVNIKTSDSIASQNEIQELVDSYINKFNQEISLSKLTTQLAKLPSIKELLSVSLSIGGQLVTDRYICNEFSYINKVDLTINIK